MTERDKERLYLTGGTVALCALVVAGLELVKGTSYLRWTAVLLIASGAVLTLNLALLATGGEWPRLVKTGRLFLWLGFGLLGAACAVSALCIAGVLAQG